MAENVSTGFWVFGVPTAETVPVVKCTHNQTAVVQCHGYLGAIAKPTTDCQALCRSLEAAFKGVHGIKPGAFTAIPSMCGIYSLPLQLCPTIDSSKEQEAAKPKCYCHCQCQCK